MFDSFKPGKVSIIGAAKSGLAAAGYFKSRGVDVFVSDTCPESKLMSLLGAKDLSGIPHESVGHTEKVLEADLIVLSPGVRSDIPVLLSARAKGIPVWSEMELGYRASKAMFLAVTGSTGKSTTVSLLGEALKAGGKNAVVAGNIGIPVISMTPQLPSDAIVVAEVSSFQLETIDKFHPHAAAVLNFMKNHLDRYATEDDYYNAKKEIARNMNRDDFLVLNARDPKLREWAKEIGTRVSVIYFGEDMAGADCFWPENGFIRYRFQGRSGTILETAAMKIQGLHNYENACVAAAMAKAAGVDDTSIARGICSFEGLAHRLEFAGETGGVRYFNDSKSTTAESITCAVSAFDKGVHLIAGGRDKGCDFTVVNNAILKHVKDICLIGEAADRMYAIWQGLVPIYRASTLDEAVSQTVSHAVPGDTVVFSPGCSSYDMFANFEERGEVFKKIVLTILSRRDGQ